MGKGGEESCWRGCWMGEGCCLSSLGGLDGRVVIRIWRWSGLWVVRGVFSIVLVLGLSFFGGGIKFGDWLVVGVVLCWCVF